MRLSSLTSFISLACLLVLPSRGAINVTIPDLYQCEPATFLLSSRGNLTIEARDSDHDTLVLRVRLPLGTDQYTWDAVDIPANNSALITVTDKWGSSLQDTEQSSINSTILPSPSNNSTCIRGRRTDHHRKHGRGPEIPILASVLGGFLLLLVLLVFLMMYRRKRENHSAEKPSEHFIAENDHLVDASTIPAGGGYMAKLVPGLQMPVMPQTPADPSLLPANQDSRPRRKTINTWRPESSQDLQLPSYRDSYKDRPTSPSAHANHQFVYPPPHQPQHPSHQTTYDHVSAHDTLPTARSHTG